MPVDLEDDIERRPSRVDNSEADEKLLVEIRERYRDYEEAWRDSHDERNIDIKYICGDPWTVQDRAARVDAGRPCINHDELNQYVHVLVNGIRQSRRGILVTPQGEGSNDQTARFKQDLIRTIEYDSNAPSIYATAFQSMVEGSYGFFRVAARYIHDDADSDDPNLFDQEIVIKPIPNPDSVLFSPNCKEPDWSDAEDCFVLDPIPKDEFKRRYPDAQITDFSALDYEITRTWIQQKLVLVAEYWRIETKKVTKYHLESGEVTSSPRGRKVKTSRQVPVKTVHQYVTNGIEILERHELPGTILPIVPMIGLSRYVNDTGLSKRVLFSLVRLGRDPQMSLAYLNSQEMEEAGLSPKSPFLGYKGQFDSSRKQWESVTKQAWGFLEADIPDNWPPGQVPPLPSRVPFTPNFAAYEVAKDSCRRAIQAAMGLTPLPTAAQRAGEKSGVALQRIEDEQALGSYHFNDGFDRALRLAGRIMDEWIPAIYDNERVRAIRQPDESYKMIRMNTAEPYADEKTGTLEHFPVTDVDHSISISTGPSFQSQRQAVSDFLDNLIEQLPKLPIAPPQAAKLLAMSIQMKDLGPKGDMMAELISPTQGTPGQGMQQMQMMQAQGQQQAMLIQQMQAELQKLQLERQAKLIDNQYSMAIEKMKLDTQLAVAEINTKAQELKERAKLVSDAWNQVHEAGMQGREHAHAQATTQAELAADALQQQAQQAHEANQQTAQQAHEANQQAAQQALAQQQQPAQPQEAQQQ